MTRPARPTSAVVRDAVLDLLCVAAFVLIGRRSHDEASGLEGFLRVAWPFAAALVVTTLVTVGTRPGRWWTGVAVWLGTVGGGMALRIGVQDRPLKVGFLVVTALFLALTMLGWRTLAWAVWPRVRRRTR